MVLLNVGLRRQSYLLAEDSVEYIVKRLLLDIDGGARLDVEVVTLRAAAVEHVLLITTTQSLLHHFLDPRLLHLGRVLDQLLTAVLACPPSQRHRRSLVAQAGRQGYGTR